MEKIINNYAHNYRDMEMSEDSLRDMLTIFLQSALYEGKRDIGKRGFIPTIEFMIEDLESIRNLKNKKHV